MFSKKLNIGEGKKYDVNSISKDGITAEELAELKKKDAKLIDIYNSLGANKDGLSKLDLANAMDGFLKADNDRDGKLSKKELNEYAKKFNEQHSLTGDKAVDGNDLRKFLKSVRDFTKDDVKVSVADVKAEDAKAKAEEKALKDAEYHKKMQEITSSVYNNAMANIEEQKRADEAAKNEAERIKDLQTPKNYTVQHNDRLDDLLKRSLDAQGVEVNDENMAKAKEEFIKNNPKALHGPKGKEYLYAGDVVKIPGNLTDKANSKEITDGIVAKRKEAEAKAEELKKQEALRNAQEVDDELAAQEDLQASMEQVVNVEKDGQVVARRKMMQNGDFEYYPINSDSSDAKLAMTAEKFASRFDKETMSVYFIDLMAEKYGEAAVKEFIETYDKNAKANGKKTVGEQLNIRIDYAKRIALGIEKEYTFPPKDDATVKKQVDFMNKFEPYETLANGFSRRDIPGARDGYFDAQGNRITKEVFDYFKAKENN